MQVLLDNTVTTGDAKTVRQERINTVARWYYAYYLRGSRRHPVGSIPQGRPACCTHFAFKAEKFGGVHRIVQLMYTVYLYISGTKAVESNSPTPYNVRKHDLPFSAVATARRKAVSGVTYSCTNKNETEAPTPPPNKQTICVPGIGLFSPRQPRRRSKNASFESFYPVQYLS